MTPYPEVNALLRQLLPAVQAILGSRFVGMYLDGSLALGDFDPDKSDIDFAVLTEEELPDEVFVALRDMHARLATEEPKWGVELEGAYIAARAVRHHDPRPVQCLCLDRGERLKIVRQESGYWVIHRHILREHGVVLAGPPLETLIDPVRPDELRQAAADVLDEWWVPMLDDTALLQKWGYRAYAILTMCRILYTLQHVAIVSKPVAARWAQGTLDPRWIPLIDQALAWSPDARPDLDETLAFIPYTRDRRLTAPPPRAI